MGVRVNQRVFCTFEELRCILGGYCGVFVMCNKLILNVKNGMQLVALRERIDRSITGTAG